MATYTHEAKCTKCGEVFDHEYPADKGVDLIQQQVGLITGEIKTLHDHVDEIRGPAQARGDVDLAPSITAALEPAYKTLASIQESQKALMEHPTPTQTIDHWKTCPTCKPTFEAALDIIRPLPKPEPPAAVSAPPKPEEKPKPPPLKRKAYPDVVSVPESRFVREGYGLKTVQQDGKFYVQAESEAAGKEAIEMRVAEKGCEFKCDETGCWWLCEKE